MAGNTRGIPQEEGRKSPKSPRLFDVKTAAAYLGLSPYSVRDLCARGELPVVRYGAKDPD